VVSYGQERAAALATLVLAWFEGDATAARRWLLDVDEDLERYEREQRDAEERSAR
jgi:hypothetical protein